MRSCAKNERPLYVLNYKGKTAYIGSDGYETGEETITYSKAIPFKANISGAKGNSAVEVFGTNLDYDKVLTLSQRKFGELKITDNSVFFIEIKPTYDSNHYPLYDYRVKRIADTPNEVVIALERVRNNG